MTALYLPTSPPMVNFFMVGSERVTWELVAVGNAGVCRLSINHAGGTIVEYFTSSAAALQRERELEAMMSGVSANTEYAS